MIEKEKFTFAAWYEKNKEALNAKRKKRYKLDLEYRSLTLQRSKLYRTKGSSRGLTVSNPDILGGYSTKVNSKTSDAILSGNALGKLSLVQLCDLAGMSIDTLITLKRRGWINTPTKDVDSPLFSGSQALALATINDELQKVRGCSNSEQFEVLKPHLELYNSMVLY